MAVQTVTSENFQQFVTTGEVPELPPIDKPAEKAPEKEPEAKVETKEIDNKPDSKKNDDSLSDSDLTERAKKRIDTKHRQMREAQELADARAIEVREAKAQAERLQQELDALKSSSQLKDDGKPNPKDFDDPFAFAEALAKYESKKAIEADREERAKERQKAEEKARIDAFSKRVAEAKKTLTDFDEVVSSCEYILKQDGIDFLLDSEHGARLTYYLATNEEEVERLNGLSHARRLAALGRLEAKFENQEPVKVAEKVPESIPTTKAPAPIATLSGGGSAVEKDPSKMSTQEYLVYRRQQQIARRKH